MHIRKNRTLHNILLMGLTTIFAQSINILAQPILTRIVSADVLGIYTFLVSLASVVIPVASLKMDMLIVTEENDKEAQYITDSCIVLTFIISIIYFVFVCIAYNCGDNIFNKYGFIVFFVPLVVFTNGLRFIFISYNNRYRQYKVIGIIGIVRESSRAIIQIVLGLLKFDVLGQIFGYTLAPIFGMMYQTKEYRKKLPTREKLDWRRFCRIIKKGKQQILYLVPAQFVGSFSSSLIIIFITSLYTSDKLGYYSAGVRLLEIPLIFISASVSKVCYKQISEDVSFQRKTLNTFYVVSLVLSVISFVIFCVLYIIAPIFSEFVFGKGYSVSGEYIRCLCLMYAVRLVSTSFVGVFTIFNKQKIELYLTSLLVIIAFLIFVLCKVYGFEITHFLWMISIAYSFLYLAIWMGYFLLCRKHDVSLISKHDVVS